MFWIPWYIYMPMFNRCRRKSQEVIRPRTTLYVRIGQSEYVKQYYYKMFSRWCSVNGKITKWLLICFITLFFSFLKRENRQLSSMTTVGMIGLHCRPLTVRYVLRSSGWLFLQKQPAFDDFYVNNQFLYGTFLQNNLPCCYCNVFANICHNTHGVYTRFALRWWP